MDANTEDDLIRRNMQLERDLAAANARVETLSKDAERLTGDRIGLINVIAAQRRDLADANAREEQSANACDEAKEELESVWRVFSKRFGDVPMYEHTPEDAAKHIVAHVDAELADANEETEKYRLGYREGLQEINTVAVANADLRAKLAEAQETIAALGKALRTRLSTALRERDEARRVLKQCQELFSHYDFHNLLADRRSEVEDCKKAVLAIDAALASERTPRKSMQPTEVSLVVCDNCGRQMKPESSPCIQCGYSGKIGSERTGGER